MLPSVKLRDLAFSILLIFSFAMVNSANYAMYGVLEAQSSTQNDSFCILWYPEFGVMPNETDKGEFRVLQDERHNDWCEKRETDVKDKIVLLENFNCSWTNQSRIIEKSGGKGVIFVGSIAEMKYRRSQYMKDHNISRKEYSERFPYEHDVNITLAIISDKSVKRLEKMGNVTVRQYVTTSVLFDFSVILMLVLAMFTITMGSYWSGNLRFAIFLKERGTPHLINNNRQKSGQSRSSTANAKQPGRYPFDTSALEVSSLNIICFVCMMVVSMILMYFFLGYLVYFALFIFTVGTSISTYSCFYSAFKTIGCWPLKFSRLIIKWNNKSYCFNMGNLCLYVLSLSTSIYWLLTRKDSYSWILQDILGVLFCLYMLRAVRFPNLKVCAVLLGLLFVYDIFFVFVTPFITGRAESIMEIVATGGKSDEQVPMVFKFAHIGFHPLLICFEQYSLIGYGDILIPGLVTSYFRSFDLTAGIGCRYFPLSIVGYLLGLFATFAGVYFMRLAQPALLYLVPAILIPTMLMSLCRKEFKLLWNGINAAASSSKSKAPEVQVAQSSGEQDPTVGHEIEVRVDNDVESARVPKSDERNSLLPN